MQPKILFCEKPAKFLLLLLREYTDEPKTMSWLSWQTKCNFSHVITVINKYEKEGIVVREKQGRMQLLSLTKKGYIIAQHIEKIMELLDENKNKDEGQSKTDSAHKSEELGKIQEKV